MPEGRSSVSEKRGVSANSYHRLPIFPVGGEAISCHPYSPEKKEKKVRSQKFDAPGEVAFRSCPGGLYFKRAKRGGGCGGFAVQNGLSVKREKRLRYRDPLAGSGERKWRYEEAAAREGKGGWKHTM